MNLGDTICLAEMYVGTNELKHFSEACLLPAVKQKPPK